MGRKYRMPRPPDVLRKGGGHRDRRAEEQEEWFRLQLEEARRDIANWQEWERESMRRETGNLIVAIVDNPNEEDTDA